MTVTFHVPALPAKSFRTVTCGWDTFNLLDGISTSSFEKRLKRGKSIHWSGCGGTPLYSAENALVTCTFVLYKFVTMEMRLNQACLQKFNMFREMLWIHPSQSIPTSSKLAPAHHLRLNCLKKIAKTVSKQLNHHTSSQQRDGRGEQPQIQIRGKGCTVRLNACIGNCFVFTNQKQFSCRLQNHACEQRYVFEAIPGSDNGCIQMTFTTCEFVCRHNGPTLTACFKSAPFPRN